MKTLFILNDAPYGSEKCYNALRLAHALLKVDPEHEVTVFLMADAVATPDPDPGAPPAAALADHLDIAGRIRFWSTSFRLCPTHPPDARRQDAAQIGEPLFCVHPVHRIRVRLHDLFFHNDLQRVSWFCRMKGMCESISSNINELTQSRVVGRKH